MVVHLIVVVDAAPVVRVACVVPIIPQTIVVLASPCLRCLRPHVVVILSIGTLRNRHVRTRPLHREWIAVVQVFDVDVGVVVLI